MSEIQRTRHPPERTILTEIVLVPVEAEVHDLEALGMVEDVTAAVLSGLQALPDYRSPLESDAPRVVGSIVLLGELAQHIVAPQDVLIALLQAGSAAIGVLAKQRRVRKIMVTLDGESISVENPATITAEQLLDAFLAKHPAAATALTPASQLHVTATVSKKARAARAAHPGPIGAHFAQSGSEPVPKTSGRPDKLPKARS